MAEKIGTHMADIGLKFLHESVPQKLEKEGEKIKVTYTEKGETKTGEYDTVLFAIGRTALTGTINLEAVGLKNEQISPMDDLIFKHTLIVN